MKQFKAVADLVRIRNLGVVAHIDAGKTTLTERMLYYSGALPQPGNVDDGDTVTDYLAQERARGITIRAAAISLKWRNYQVNLIDTPGHIDFNGEVERALRVMDGGVVVLDSSKGVETQTLTVWRQCDKFHVPRLVFCNKLDSGGAQVDLCTNTLKSKLKIQPLLMQIPLGVESKYRGHIDLVSLLAYEYVDLLGDRVNVTQVADLDAPVRAQALLAREGLLDAAATLDDELATLYLDGQVTSNDLQASIRRLTRKMQAFPVFLGSALKNRGVQALMDAVIEYLPSPSESRVPQATDISGQARQVKTDDPELRALAFKYIYDHGRLPLTYVRVYSGRLKANRSLKNTSGRSVEKPSRIYRVQAGQYVELDEVGAGDIAALAGLKNTRSGDTLVLKTDQTTEVLPGVEMPPPVFFCSILAESEASQPQLEEVLAHLVKEDPSLMVRHDEENNSTLITGQGELHLEILRDRLLQDFKLKVVLGPMQVAYRESVRKPVKLTYCLDRSSLFMQVSLELELRKEEEVNASVDAVFGTQHFKSLQASAVFNFKEPAAYNALLAQADKDKQQRTPGQGKSKAEIDLLEFLPLSQLSESLKTELLTELQESLLRGCLLGYPVIEVEVSVVDGLASKSRTSSAAVRECAAKSIQELLRKGDPYLLEPMMRVRVEVPQNVLGEVIADLTSVRRFEVMEVSKEATVATVDGTAPLSELVGYSSVLRSLSRGAGVYSMQYCSYAFVGELTQHKLL